MYGETKKLIWLNYNICLIGELSGLEPNLQYLQVLPVLGFQKGEKEYKQKNTKFYFDEKAFHTSSCK